jgi:hypothetical protein
MSSSTVVIRHKYREMAKLVKRLSDKQHNPEQSWSELRTAFRQPLQQEESIQQRLQKADERLAFLKMITPKSAASSATTTTSKGGRWIYKNGQRLEHANGTLRDSNGRVVSNWDGKNLDPESVKRHNHHLKKLGFRNNAHAKGIF